MKRALKIFVLILFIGFVALQFFQIDKTNPPIVQAETLEAVVTVPADVQMIIGRSCNDCHSNTTQYPWYSHIQPAAWFLKGHIDKGKAHLNFSTFATNNMARQVKRLEEVCEEVESGEMPLPSYLYIHRDAVLTDSDKKTLCDWTKEAIVQLSKN